MAIGRFLKAARPAPRKPAPKKPTPVKPTPSPGLPMSPDRGNVERNYRGIPGLVNATAPIPPSVKPPTNIYSKRPGMPEIGFPAIPSPGAPRMISPGPTPPSGGATGSTGFKSAFGGIDSNMLAPSGGAPGNPTGIIGGTGARADFGMKKGGSVKASKAPKASSASKRGDGIAIKGKTKGRFV